MIDTSYLPEALISNSSEYFTSNNKRYITSNGVTVKIDTFPSQFFNLLSKELASDKKSLIGLDKLKITDQNKRVEKLYDCNFSSFDHFSDVSECGTKLGPREYIPCNERDTCKAHGFLCKIPCGLTVRQFQIAKRIALGDMDAKICCDLYISQETLRTHKNNIERKIGRTGKVSIGVWAAKNLKV